VIVVDNGSSDATAEVAKRHGASVVRDEVANRSRARNRGVEAARSELYAFTDADCVASPVWLHELLACAGSAQLVAGEVKLRTREEPNAVERFEALWRFGQAAWVKDGSWATALGATRYRRSRAIVRCAATARCRTGSTRRNGGGCRDWPAPDMPLAWRARSGQSCCAPASPQALDD